MPTKWFIGLIFIFCCDFALAASCGKDEVLIIKTKILTKNPRYSVGNCLKTSQIYPPKFLKQGEHIVVEFSNKQKRTIYGPENNLIRFLKKIIEKLISPRGYSDCDIWDIDISVDEEAFCYESTKELFLCREDVDYSTHLFIEDHATGKLYKRIWLYGKARFLLPQDKFPIRDGVSYQFKISDDRWKTITFYKVPKTFSGNKETSWMIDKRCYRQANIRVPVVIKSQNSEGF
jgi:hypothetical protein